MAQNKRLLEERTDDELAELARHRREHPSGAIAMQLLLDRYRQQRSSLARRYGGRADFDDLAQEAAIAVVRAVDTHRPEKGPIGPWIWQWMWGATLRAAKECWSTARAVPLESVRIELLCDGAATVAEGVAEVLAREQDLAALADALRHLPERERQALLDPRGHRPSLRRTALAMLRHPSVRPVVAGIRAPNGTAADEPPPSSIVDGGTPRSDRLVDQGSSWVYRASCRGTPPALFWGRDVTTRRRAMDVCARCSVRSECLLDALILPAGGGIRAGTTEKERRVLKQLLAGNQSAPFGFDQSTIAGAAMEPAFSHELPSPSQSTIR